MTAPERLQLFRSIDDRLATQPGHHRRPDWWDALAARGYLHPTAQRTIAEVGRGGDKSTMGRRFAETEMLSRWSIPGNERHYFAWVSENNEEAAQRPRQVETDLKALGIPCERSGNTVDIVGMPIGFKAFACRVGAVSGFRCIGFVCDEESKWSSADNGANPAREVVASLRAMTVTHPEAREWHLSSPLGMLDYHFEQFAQGDTDFQIVGNAPSWVANPAAITEAQTRRLEPDQRIWAREYLAQPSSGAGSAFDLAAVERAFAQREPGQSEQRILVVDPSSGRKDTWAWAVASVVTPVAEWPASLTVRERFVEEVVEVNGVWRRATRCIRDPFVQEPDGTWVPFTPAHSRPLAAVHLVDGIEGAFFDQIPADEIVDRLAVLCRQWGIRHVHGDQREDYALASLFSKVGLKFHSHAWTSSTKPDAVAHLRRWFADNAIALPEHEKLRRELGQFEERITPSGALTFGARGSGHDDYVALLVTLALTDIEGGLPGSPFRAGKSRHEIAPGDHRLENRT